MEKDDVKKYLGEEADELMVKEHRRADRRSGLDRREMLENFFDDDEEDSTFVISE